MAATDGSSYKVMKLEDVLLKANDIITYVKMRQKRKLYMQWVEKDQLPIQVVPQEILDATITRRKVKKSYIPYT